MSRSFLAILLPAALCGSPALAQSSSIGRRDSSVAAAATTPAGGSGAQVPNGSRRTGGRNAAPLPLAPPSPAIYGALLRSSLIAISMATPKTFKVHDLITVIVREQHKFESDGDRETKNKFTADSELDAFIKFTGGGIGSSAFRRGKPNIDYKLNVNNKDEADKKREDTLTTRITAEIIDIKPNGNLVLSAEKLIEYDEETSVLTLTGTCRSGDVTPDNTVLSTQIADTEVRVKNVGSVNDATKRGWFTKLFGQVKPF